MHGRNNLDKAFIFFKRCDEPYAHSRNRTAQQAGIEGVPYEVILRLQNVEGAMVGRQLIDVEGNIGNEGHNGQDEGTRARQ